MRRNYRAVPLRLRGLELVAAQRPGYSVQHGGLALAVVPADNCQTALRRGELDRFYALDVFEFQVGYTYIISELTLEEAEAIKKA